MIKLAIISVLGPPVVAVVIFEVLLNATAMFNHGNVRLPLGLDPVLRWLVVTSDMHRVHHSVEDDEANSNFGFNLPWWDRLFGTYRDQPRVGHEDMTIGIHKYRDPKRVDQLPGMLPGAIAFTYLGYAGREAVAGGEGLIQKAMLALALLAIVAFLPRIISRLRQGPTLSIGELNERMSIGEELLVLDVRTANDYQGELGYIVGSRNIPLEELESRLHELSPYLEKPIALVCTTDRRSKKAAQILGSQGFADVHVVIGGMTQWNKDGLPAPHRDVPVSRAQDAQERPQN